MLLTQSACLFYSCTQGFLFSRSAIMFSESEMAEYSFGFAYDDEYGSGGRFDDYDDDFDDESDFEDDEDDISFDDLQDDEVDTLEESFDDIEPEDGYGSFSYREDEYFDVEDEQDDDFDDED